MKILISVAGFFPAQKYGGPAVSIRNICRLLSDDKHDMYVVTCDHEMNDTKRLEGIIEGWNRYENFQVQYLSTINYVVLSELVKELSPDIIYVNSLFDTRFSIPFMRIAKKTKIPTIIAPRGEICENAFNSKYKKIPFIYAFRPFFRLNNVYFHATADDEESQIVKYIRKNNIIKMSNVPSITVCQAHTRKEDGILNCVFIARIQRKKNLVGALTILKQCTSYINFDIYGPKEVDDYWNECEKIIKEEPNNIRVRYCGTLEHDMVKGTFSNYDLFLFPTYSENYGHSIIESLQAGTPVLISDQTPWTDLQDYNAGWALPLDNMQKFSEIIDRFNSISKSEFLEKSCNAQEYVRHKLKIEILRQKYIKTFDEIISKKF